PHPPRYPLFPYTTLFRSWRVANIAADAFFNLRIDGTRMWQIARDANPLRAPEPVDSIFIPPGTRAEVLVLGGAPGRYAIRHSTRSEEHTSELQSLAYLVC